MGARRFWGMRETKRGDPQAAPWSLEGRSFASLARDAKLGMRNGDVLGPALERRIFRAVEPLESELAGLDPLDGGEPEALELALLVPIGGQDPGADPKGLSSGRAVRLGNRRCGGSCTRGSRGDRTRGDDVRVLFCRGLSSSPLRRSLAWTGRGRPLLCGLALRSGGRLLTRPSRRSGDHRYPSGRPHAPRRPAPCPRQSAIRSRKTSAPPRRP